MKSRIPACLLVAAAAPALLLASPAQAKSYKGAEVYSRKAFLYGRMEMRMRMIRGSGLLSTFFTYKEGSERSGAFWEEIDLEVFGKGDAKSWQSNIISNSPKTMSEKVHPVDTSLADAYHTYTVEWAPTYVSWLVDGEVIRKVEGGQAADLTNPESLRFNVWSSESAAWVGEFDESALPAYQFVNWIKYYRYDNGNFVLDWTDDFDTFDGNRWSKGSWTFEGNRVDFATANAVTQDSTLILAITREGETGFKGTVPADPQGGAGGGTTSPTSTQTATNSGTTATATSSASNSTTTTGTTTGTTTTNPGASAACNFSTRGGSGAGVILGLLALLGLGRRRDRTKRRA